MQCMQACTHGTQCATHRDCHLNAASQLAIYCALGLCTFSLSFPQSWHKHLQACKLPGLVRPKRLIPSPDPHTCRLPGLVSFEMESTEEPREAQDMTSAIFLPWVCTAVGKTSAF
jgi:hypothetical protein